MDAVVQNLINDIKRLGTGAQIKNLERIGGGHFSMVYAHPKDTNKVIKITTHDVSNDGYPTFVSYVQAKPGYSIYPVIYEFHEGRDKNGSPFFVTVLERLTKFYNIEDQELREEVVNMYNAVLCVDQYFNIDARDNAEMISRLFKRYTNSIPEYWEHLTLAERLEIREVHDMIFSLCDEWEPEWGLAPDFSADNIMFRLVDGKYQCVVTDPLACGDIYHCAKDYLEELMA